VNATPSSERYGLGIILGIALGLWLGALSLVALFTPHLDYGLIVLLILAVAVGGPMAAVLLVIWIVYMGKARGRLPGKVHGLMFGPPLLALCIVPLAMQYERSQGLQFMDEHPAVYETHVNLSGAPLWLAPDAEGHDATRGPPRMPMRSGSQAQFVGFMRYPRKEDVVDGSFPYDGAHLRSGVDTYTYGLPDEADGWSTARGRSVPLVRLPYPDLYQVTRYEPEHVVLVQQYFHYRDHVELAPSLSVRAMTNEEKLLGKVDNLVQFQLSEHAAPAIARLEVNGQTLALGLDGAIKPDAGCEAAFRPAGEALLDLGRALKLRWQTLDDPGHWREASITLPPLPAANYAAPVSLPSVLLYFTGNGQVAAERFQLQRDGDRLLLRASGLPAGVPREQTCGSAVDGFDPASVTLLR
jgi:hypothetical protein